MARYREVLLSHETEATAIVISKVHWFRLTSAFPCGGCCNVCIICPRSAHDQCHSVPDKLARRHCSHGFIIPSTLMADKKTCLPCRPSEGQFSILATHMHHPFPHILHKSVKLRLKCATSDVDSNVETCKSNVISRLQHEMHNLDGIFLDRAIIRWGSKVRGFIHQHSIHDLAKAGCFVWDNVILFETMLTHII